MTDSNSPEIRADDFDINSLEDEIQADRQCTELLKNFAAYQVNNHELPPIEAGKLAHGADPFLRDFMIAKCRENLFRPRKGRVRQFAGHFYIVNNMEPNRVELVGMLEGIEAFYRYCLKLKVIDAAVAEMISEECARIDQYAARIESFWDLEGDGFITWREEIPLD